MQENERFAGFPPELFCANDNLICYIGSIAIGTNHDFQRIFRGAGGQLDGGGGLFERERMGDQWAHVELAREDEARDFALEGEIGGIAAEQILFVHANGGQIKAEG